MALKSAEQSETPSPRRALDVHYVANDVTAPPQPPLPSPPVPDLLRVLCGR